MIPSGKAVSATEENRAKFDARREKLEADAAKVLEQAKDRYSLLEKMEVAIPHRVGEEGKLFGSVGTVDIAKAITAAGVEIQKHEVRLPTGALRQVGEYPVEIHLHPELSIDVKIKVVPEE